MLTPKTLTYELDTQPLSLNQVATLFYNLFTRKDYDWWYEILPDDIVVDIGAGIGEFSAKALDAGAEKVYMVEPSLTLMKTAIKNVSSAFIDTATPRVVPINAAIGRTDIDLDGVFKSVKSKEEDNDPKLMSLREMLDTYNIDRIDYLKVSVAGSEYNILHENYIDFLSENVRHIAVRCHLDAQYGSAEKFIEWRDRVLKHFIQKDKVRFQDSSLQEKLFQSNWKEVVPREFMVYITNW